MKTNYWTLVLACIGWGVMFINPSTIQNSISATELPGWFSSLFPHLNQSAKWYSRFLLLAFSSGVGSLGVIFALLKAKKQKYSFIGLLLNLSLILVCCAYFYFYYFGTKGFQ